MQFLAGREPSGAVCRRAFIGRFGLGGLIAAPLLLAGCGGGSGGGATSEQGPTPTPTPTPAPAPTPTPPATSYTQTSLGALRETQRSIAPLLDQVPVFVSSEERSAGSGTSSFYRIPGITRGRSLIHAFAEARLNQADGGETSIAWRTLSPAGGNVSRETILVEQSGPWADGVVRRNTHHNPCPVYDPVEGRLHLLFGHRRGDVSEDQATLPSVSPDTSEVMRAIVSPDGDGAEWLDRVGGARLILPADYTRAAEVGGRMADWRLFCSGPGHGICMPDRTLLAPGWVERTDGSYRTIILRYDRAAARWSVIGMLPLDSNEASLTWSSTGKLIVNARHRVGGARVVAISSDNGRTWDSARIDPELPDPMCFGSVLRIGATGGPNLILFCNAANPSERRDLEIKLSLDDHATFEAKRRLYPNFSETLTTSWEGRTIAPTFINHYTAYSDLVALDGGDFAFLVEQSIASNSAGSYASRVINLVRGNLSWLLQQT